MEVPWSNCFWMVSKILPMLQRWRFAVCGFWGNLFFLFFVFRSGMTFFFLVGFWFFFFFGERGCWVVGFAEHGCVEK